LTSACCARLWHILCELICLQKSAGAPSFTATKIKCSCL